MSSSFDGPSPPDQPAPPDVPVPAESAPQAAPIAPPPAAPPPPVGWSPPPPPPGGPDYPVNVGVPRDPGQNRLWGIPFVGIWVRGILLIPVAFVLFFLVMIAAVLVLVSWIPVLVSGRQAGFVYQLVGGTIRLSTRSALYALLVTGRYPWFSDDHPITVTFDEDESQNRLWGIPFVGICVRVILLIPHFIVLWVLGIVVGLLVLVSWIPVLVNGRQADVIVDISGGLYRWSARVGAYAMLLTGKYPPFRLGD